LSGKLLSYGALSPRVQRRLVQAQYVPPPFTSPPLVQMLPLRAFIATAVRRYWDDPFKHEEYLQRNVFLPDLNNEFANKSR
jgi:hypothetical protein